jgi:hypothetical protein
VSDPETKELASLNGWQMMKGAARGGYKQMFAIMLSTHTKGSVPYFIASVFTDKKHMPIVQEFLDSDSAS